MNGFKIFFWMAVICVIIGVLYVVIGGGSITIQECTYGPNWSATCK